MDVAILKVQMNMYAHANVQYITSSSGVTASELQTIHQEETWS